MHMNKGGREDRERGQGGREDNKSWEGCAGVVEREGRKGESGEGVGGRQEFD